MKEIKITTKFNIGEKVYTIWNRTVAFPCPICKGKENNCKRCYGAGQLHTSEKIWQVDKEPMEVIGIKILINNDGEQTISYNLHNAKGKCRKRADHCTFTTLEEAQAYCDSLNVNIKSKVEEEIKLVLAEYDAMKKTENSLL